MTASTPSTLAATTEHRVVEVLRARILEGKFAVGERLRQDFISAELGVSSTPVREAFRRLAAEGLLTIATHRGVVVRDLSFEERVELLELVRLIDTHNLAQAVPLADKATIAEAQRIQEDLRTTVDPARWASLNRQFHWTLGAPSGRPRALALLGELLNLSALHIRDDIHSLPGRREEALDEHERILEAYERGDVESTTAASHAHTTNALNHLELRRPSV